MDSGSPRTQCTAAPLWWAYCYCWRDRRGKRHLAPRSPLIVSEIIQFQFSSLCSRRYPSCDVVPVTPTTPPHSHHMAVQTEPRPSRGLAPAPPVAHNGCLGALKRTERSSQTEHSMYRRACEVQTFPPRDAAVQCPRSVACCAGTSAELAAVPVRTPPCPSVPRLTRVSPSRGRSYIQDVCSSCEEDTIPATSFLELLSARASPVSPAGSSSAAS